MQLPNPSAPTWHIAAFPGHPAELSTALEGLRMQVCDGIARCELLYAAPPDVVAAQVRPALEQAFGDRILCQGAATLPEQLLARLGTRTVALAESCTGGLIASELTRIPGASRSFLGSAVVYANSAKIGLLGVREDTLATFGAASCETAAEMAAGARARFGADFTVSVTGVAGPGGGTEWHPVGHVCFGLPGVREITGRLAALIPKSPATPGWRVAPNGVLVAEMRFGEERGREDIQRLTMSFALAALLAGAEAPMT